MLTFAAAPPGLDGTRERLGRAVTAREGWRWRGLASDDASLEDGVAAWRLLLWEVTSAALA